jgi:hypothetical protein
LNYGLDWVVTKICLAQDLASHDFGYCLVSYQNLLIPHIWLVKSMARFFYLTLACQIFGMINFGRKSIRRVILIMINESSGFPQKNKKKWSNTKDIGKHRSTNLYLDFVAKKKVKFHSKKTSETNQE